jgi:CubicO group peptidase (beta-lactamase class C family)
MSKRISYFLLLAGIFLFAFRGRAQVVHAEFRNDKFKHDFIIQNKREYARKMIHNPEALRKLDTFLSKAIQNGVFPGCQVLATKNGQIIYKKNFGKYTYDASPAITDATLFDIASVSKILATTLAVMKLVDEHKIRLNDSLKTYLGMVNGTDKANLIIRDLLLHQAGLKAWIPFYKETLDSITGDPRADLYRSVSEKEFNIPVAEDFFLKNTYIHTMWEEVLNSPLENDGRYVYSDLDFYFLKKVVEQVSGMSLEQYVTTYFYQPLGLKHTLYNPWKKGLQMECAPTEKDMYFRHQTLHGYVHDPGAAMLGGIGGHAGIFSTTSDMAVILQMLLNGGTYKGHRYINRETLALFTDYQSSLSRRGLGFDKPEKEIGDGGPASELCDKSTFGHQGFTGTCAWADPQTGIIFIFLSNRVYPTADNWKISHLNIRTDAQSYIYEALGYGSN